MPDTPRSRYATVFEMPLTAATAFSLRMPSGAELLGVGVTRPSSSEPLRPCLWARARRDGPFLYRRFRLLQNDESLEGPDADAPYVGSFQVGPGVVYHLFDGGESESP